jgi:hypothetical protein
LLAVQILGAGNAALREEIVRFKRKLAAESKAKNRKLQREWRGGAGK